MASSSLPFKSYYYKPTVRISVFFIQNGYFQAFEELSDILKNSRKGPRNLKNLPRKTSEKMSDLCEVETDGFIIFMEVLYGLVVTIGILANALVCSVFLSDIRIKNVSKLTITTCIYQNFSVISDIWLLIYQLQTQFIYFLHYIYLSK